MPILAHQKSKLQPVPGEHSNTPRQRMPPPSSPDIHTKILDYWSRRKTLRPDEWVDFYRITSPILMKTQLPAEYADRKNREALVHMFFAEKVFLNAATTKAGPLKNVYALHGFLKNYAEDIRRKSSWEELIGDPAGEEQRKNKDDIGQTDGQASSAPAMSIHHLLAEAGIDVDKAADSARVFVEDLEDGERAYLRHHSCAREEKPEPVKSIAERFAMGTSYHYKAQRLGITSEKGATHKDYKKTMIGRWLMSVGAKLIPEWQEELAALLNLLCQKVHEYKKGAK